MSDNSVIIIGAGIAGLSAGCYAQMNGYRSHIFELHSLPGGLCTSWKRQGYTFDGCIHWLIGAGPGSGLHRVWEELGALQGRPFVYHDEFLRVQGPDGKSLTVYTDIDRLERHLMELAPADARHIAAYANAARRFTRFDLFALSLLSPREMLGLLPHSGTLLKWGRMTMADFASGFTDPLLRQAFPLIHNYPAFPMAGHLANLAAWHRRNSGWPVGGSLAFARSIERRYRDLGGEIHYRSPVQKILVDKGARSPRASHRAVGVRLADGTEHRADVVVSAADGHTTIFDMLGGDYAGDLLRAYYAAAPDVQDHGVLVALGIDRDLSDSPHAVTHLLEQPVTIAGRERERLTFEHYCFDPGMAPLGKSVLQVWLPSGYGYWREIYDDSQRYRAEKERVAGEVIDQAEGLYPGLRDQVEVVDVATRVTIERYTGNWQGSEAWFAPRNQIGVMLRGLSRTLPGLDGFHMVGQWAGAAGGLPLAATSGRKLVQDLCRKDHRPFVTTVPGG